MGPGRSETPDPIITDMARIAFFKRLNALMLPWWMKKLGVSPSFVHARTEHLPMIAPVIFAVLMPWAVIGIAPLLLAIPVAAQLIMQVYLGVRSTGVFAFSFRRKFVREQLQLFFKRQ